MITSCVCKNIITLAAVNLKSVSVVPDEHRGTAALPHKGNVLERGLHYFMEKQTMTKCRLLFLSQLAPNTLTLCPSNLKNQTVLGVFPGWRQQKESGKGRGGLGRLVHLNEHFGMLSPFIETHDILR